MRAELEVLIKRHRSGGEGVKTPKFSDGEMELE